MIAILYIICVHCDIAFCYEFSKIFLIIYSQYRNGYIELIIFNNFCEVYPKVMNNNEIIALMESGSSAAENDRENYNRTPSYKKAIWFMPLLLSFVLKIVNIIYFYNTIGIVYFIYVWVTLILFDVLAFFVTVERIEKLVSNRSDDDVKNTKFNCCFINCIPILGQIVLFIVCLFVAFYYENDYHLK